jgi:hypothetical protein
VFAFCEQVRDFIDAVPDIHASIVSALRHHAGKVANPK